MRLYCGYIRLDFEAEFSNVLIVRITCKGPVLPDHELNVQELVRVHVEFVTYLNCDVLVCRKSWDWTLVK